MEITFCGAAGTTTGSQHLLEVNGQKILLDCGLYQGRRKDAFDRNKNFLFSPAEVDSVVLSHAHIDHSGNLPNLVKQGFRGNIYATFATRDLCQIMLADSAKIQVSDAEYASKIRAKTGLPPVEPLYVPEEAEQAMRSFVTVGYDRPIPIGKGVTLRFLDAGHILGSAQVQLDIEDESEKREYRFLFSGDIGRGANTLLRDPDLAQDVDYLLMESTYGGREHEQETDTATHLGMILKNALKKNGKIIIPAFAVERTQQLLFSLHELFEQNVLPARIPVFVDSPLAVNATEIFRLHPECFNEDLYQFLFERRDPFGFENLSLIRSAKDSKALNQNPNPAIIISASGMCEAGRVLHHLRMNIEKKSTTILFVGYCAEQTLGWKIREGWQEVKIFGEPFQVRADVEILDSFSGHADHSELLDYFQKTGGKKERTWLVHGEVSRAEALQRSLQGLDHSGIIEIPAWKQSVTI